MSENLKEPIDRLELENLRQGDVLHITLGSGEGAFQYKFTIEKQGKWPIGYIIETAPDGTSNEGQFALHGSGRWTAQRENPVQKQQRAFTSYFDSLNVGDFMIGAVPGAGLGERLVFDKPGQEITRIELS